MHDLKINKLNSCQKSDDARIRSNTETTVIAKIVKSGGAWDMFVKPLPEQHQEVRIAKCFS